MDDDRFTYGPYGEIYPPPLVGGVDPEEALQMLQERSAAQGAPIHHMPTRGRSRQGMLSVALSYVHQLKLLEAFSGQSDDPDGQALYDAVVVNGQAMSLRPPGLENLTFLTFAPVLRRIEDDKWRVGLPEPGRTVLIVADDPAQALERAWTTYVQWCNDEDAKVGEMLGEMLKSHPHSINHDYWGLQMRMGRPAVIAAVQGEASGAYAVEWLGKHDVFRLATPSGQLIVNASSPERAARFAEGIASQRPGVLVVYPSPTAVIKTVSQAAALPEPRPQEKGVLLIGDTRAGWGGGERQLAVFVKSGAKYGLLRGGDTMTLVKEDKRKPVTIARSHIAPNMIAWMQQAKGPAAILTWCVWKIESERSK